MVIIPQRLFSDENVRVFARDGQNAILQKRLRKDLIRREAYVASHAISMVLSGEQTIETYEGNGCTIREGEMILIPRGVYYVTDIQVSDDAFESILFYFDDDTVRQFTAGLAVTVADRLRAPEYLHLPQPTLVRSFVAALTATYSNAKMSPELLRLKTLELLHLSAPAFPQQTFANFLFRLTIPAKRNIRPFMEENATKPLSVADYAYLTGRSLSTFRRDFKDQFGTTPQRWIKDRRIKHAVSLLEHQDLHVTDLADAAGYQNVSYFIREFRSTTGLTPKQFMLQRKG
ncbi:AraC family transcriptional regulator [Lewinella sp. 4G2]|uniref:AraC family transcriptional regulator n=1 Tax=Lewinella sp. 4G2 TaxID=1803372 RepID=UPI0007B4E5E7|nr:AraC family transcriptional regulator [Lewinella sp. 4G2]OAV43518.1 hypothetical protein A3850_002970 [Lewinella sp. 4G2]